MMGLFMLEDLLQFTQVFINDNLLALLSVYIIINVCLLPIGLKILSLNGKITNHYHEIKSQNISGSIVKLLFKKVPLRTSLTYFLFFTIQIAVSLFVLLGISDLSFTDDINSMWWFSSLSQPDPLMIFPMFLLLTLLWHLRLKASLKSEKMHKSSYVSMVIFTLVMCFFSIKFVLYLSIYFLFKILVVLTYKKRFILANLFNGVRLNS